MDTSFPIESLINEFYHPSTQNQRKRELEHELVTYKNQPNSWEDCICYLNNFSNQYVWFFSTSTLENTITRRWIYLKLSEREQIRDRLWSTYVSIKTDDPKRQRDTIAQLIALMGKRDFPDDHPNYMQHLAELIKNKFQLGIRLLQTTSEEVVSGKEDVSSEKKRYFHSCVSICMPEIFDLIGKFLAISVCYLNGTDLNLIPDNLRDYRLHSSLPNDSQTSTSIIELLSCIQHLFSWIAMDNLISDNFLMSVFDLARWRLSNHDISTSSLSAINELFYLQKSLPFPKIVMTGVKGLLDQPELSKCNEMYQEKFTEMLRLFSEKYWMKLIDDDEFPCFLYKLYQYTFADTSYGASALPERLGIWPPIINALTQPKHGRYHEVMHSLVSDILKKMQYRFDQDQKLDMLDNETLDCNMETKWQHYINQCIETISIVCERQPFSIYQLVFNDWQSAFETFLSIDKLIEERGLETIDQTKCQLIHCILRDVSSLCQTLSRLAPILENSSAPRYPEMLIQMSQCLLYAVKFLSSRKHYLNVNSSMLRRDFSDIFREFLFAIRNMLSGSPELKSHFELRELVENIGQLLLPPSQIHSQAVCLSAAQLLLSISSEVRPKFLLEINSIIQLVQAASSLSHLSKGTITVIYEMVISCFVLPWQGLPNQEQDFEKRANVLHEYLSCLALDFLSLDQTAVTKINEPKITAIVIGTLPILKDVLEYFKESSSTVKNMLTSAFKPIIYKSLAIFNTCGCHDVDIIVAEFCLSVLRSLQWQTFVKEMLAIFIDWSTKEQITSRRLISLEKILQMILLVVEQPGSLTQSLIPSILSLALDHVLPLLTDNKTYLDKTDVPLLLYSLFDGILYHRWQYFYKSQIRRGFSPGASDVVTPLDEGPQHGDQLLAILTSYGCMLVSGNDPQISRTILCSLQKVNEQWKLYNRSFFKEHLLMSFQCALINSLLTPEGALHYDLLLNVLFSMGQVNTSKLHQSFVSVGFAAESAILEEICLCTDLPTFSQKMTLLIQDTRCMRLMQ